MKYIIKTLLLTITFLLSIDLFAAGNKDQTCSINDEIIPLLERMKDDRTGLGQAIKDDIKLVKVIKELRDNYQAEDDTLYDHKLLQSLIDMPSQDNGFENWWDTKVTVEEARTIWKHGKLRDKIEDKLRDRGGKHEWCMVCLAPFFKEFGVTVTDIQNFTTDISNGKLTWRVPADSPAKHNGVSIAGQPGRHGGLGSGHFHAELKKLILKIPDQIGSPASKQAFMNQFKQDLREFLVKWNVRRNVWPDFIK